MSAKISPMRSFVTGGMIALGVLLVALCGTCTAFVVGSALLQLMQGVHTGELFTPVGVIQLAAIFGGAPILLGGLLIWFGLRLRRGPRPPPSAPPPG